MTYQASAPSNIALIKYMGKIEGSDNKPTNSSLSWTLENLRSFVQITSNPKLAKDEWTPLKGAGLLSLELSEKSQARFIQHFQSLKAEFGITENFLIESANNFPSDCGLASSASSFAALTMAAIGLFAQMGSQKAQEMSVLEKADLSRKGSGSSCRSFFGPWVMWFQEGVRPVEFPMNNLLHQVIVVESEIKSVSSSEAHRRVTTSPLFQGRPDRAEKRLADLIEAFRYEPEKPANWANAFHIVWDEFWDMHRLFETSQPPFSYMLPGTFEVLHYFTEMWEQKKDGPLVTMDAGANIHLLYRKDQAQVAQETAQKFSSKMKVFSSFSQEEK